jgi:uncharacterized protein (DUF1697 family)
MTTYVALLRGIMPMNPNMHPSKLKEAFLKIGFKNVQTVISSGNVVFESNIKSDEAIETKIEKGLPKILGFKSSTIVRSKEDLEKLAKVCPFAKVKEDKSKYTIVTFLKHSPKNVQLELPHKGKGFDVIGITSKETFTILKVGQGKTPDAMSTLEKAFGKEITTRTWKTVNRILTKMQ